MKCHIKNKECPVNYSVESFIKCFESNNEECTSLVSDIIDSSTSAIHNKMLLAKLELMEQEQVSKGYTDEICED